MQAEAQLDIKLVYLYSTIKMMHGPINLRLFSFFSYRDLNPHYVQEKHRFADTGQPTCAK